MSLSEGKGRDRPRYVALLIDGEYTVHAPETAGNYATLCGISDDDDPAIAGTPTKLRAGSRITCTTCIAIVELARQYSKRDFAPKRERTQ